MFCWEAKNSKGEVWQFEAEPMLVNGYWHSGVGARRFVRHDEPGIPSLTHLSVTNEMIADHILALYGSRTPVIVDVLKSKLRDSLSGNVLDDGNKGGGNSPAHE